LDAALMASNPAFGQACRKNPALLTRY